MQVRGAGHRAPLPLRTEGSTPLNCLSSLAPHPGLLPFQSYSGVSISLQVGIKTAQQASPPDLLFIAFEVQKPRVYRCPSLALRTQGHSSGLASQKRMDMCAEGKVGHTQDQSFAKPALHLPVRCSNSMLASGRSTLCSSPASLPQGQTGSCLLQVFLLALRSLFRAPGTFNRHHPALHSPCYFVVCQAV